MATNTLINTDLPPNIRRYKNGALFDTEKGRIVSSKDVTTKITPERSVELLSKRLEYKRERLIAGANRVVAEGGQYDGTDLDFVEAIGEAATITALNPDSKKQIQAAEFLFREAGISDRQQQQEQQAGTLGAVTDLIGQLASFAGVLLGNAFDNNELSQALDAGAVDAVVHDLSDEAAGEESGREDEG